MEEFLASINHFEYCDFRDKCVEECNVSTAAWSYWVNGGSISAKNKPIINKVAMEMFGRPVWEEKGVEA